MSNDYFSPPNSVWPNGIKRDGEGYVTVYPLGTNKVDISTITWPEGDKLVSPYVYQNDKLVGFIDTKALTVSGTATITMNYNHIEADFASISEGTLTVNAPNATVKKFTWSVVDNEEGGNGSEEPEGDTRTTKTPYDIWKNAEVENPDGTITVKDLYVPDASGWYNDFKKMHTNSTYDFSNNIFINVVDNKAYYGADYTLDNLPPESAFAYNVQTDQIENAEKLFYVDNYDTMDD